MTKLDEIRKQAISDVLDNRTSDNLSLEVAAKMTEFIIEGCAKAAAAHAHTYADGDAGTGAYGAARAVQAYGNSLLKE